MSSGKLSTRAKKKKTLAVDIFDSTYRYVQVTRE